MAMKHPSISLFGTLSPNSVVIGYAIDGALHVSAHLSTKISPIPLTLSAQSVQFNEKFEQQASPAPPPPPKKKKRKKKKKEKKKRGDRRKEKQINIASKRT